MPLRIPRLAAVTIAVAIIMLTLPDPELGRAQGRRSPRDRGKAPTAWTPVGLSGGGAMFGPAIHPQNPDLMMLNSDMSGAYISRDGGKNWRMIHHAQLRGNTSCKPAFHPTNEKIIYAASGWSARLRVSNDGGETWKPLGDLPDRCMGQIAVHPTRPNVMFCGQEDGVWRSVDGGKKWKRIPGIGDPPIGFAFGVLKKRGPSWSYVATSEGVWRSRDLGATWRRADAGLPYGALRGFAGGFGKRACVLYATTRSKVDERGRWTNGIFRSTDGENWVPVEGRGLNKDTQGFDEWAANDVAQYYQILTTDKRPRTVYVFNGNTGIPPPHHASVYRSDDAGATWRATFYPDPRYPKYNLAPNYTTRGDGQYYQSVPNGVAISASDPNVLLFLDGGNAIITKDGGRTYFNGHTRETRTPGVFACTGLVVTSTWQYAIDPFDPRRHYIAYTDIGFARSLDGGTTWHWWGKGEKTPWRNTCYALAFDPEIRGKLWGAFSTIHDIPNANIIRERHKAEGPGGVAVSTDYGEHWKPLRGGLPDAPVTAIVVDPNSRRGRRTLWAGVFDRGVYRSDDEGGSWRPVRRGLGSGANRRVSQLELDKDGTLFALVTAKRVDGDWIAEGPGLYRLDPGDPKDTSDDRWVWLNQSRPLLWPKGFSIDPDDSRTLWLSAADADRDRGRNGGLYRTTDGGKTWKFITRKGPEHFGTFHSPYNKGWIYLTLTESAPGAGLWLSKDRGKNWAPFDALPFANIQRVTFDPKNDKLIYVTTFGGSVFKGPATPLKKR